MQQILDQCVERLERINETSTLSPSFPLCSTHLALFLTPHTGFPTYYSIAMPTIDRKREIRHDLDHKYAVYQGKGMPPLEPGAANTVRCAHCGEKNGRPFTIDGLRSHVKMK
jgi:hypothetical protein